MPTFEDIGQVFKKIEKSYFNQTVGYNGVAYDEFILIGNSIEITIDFGKMIYAECEASPLEKVKALQKDLTAFGVKTHMANKANMLLVYLSNEKATLTHLKEILKSHTDSKAFANLSRCCKRVESDLANEVGPKEARRAVRNAALQIHKIA